MGRWHFRLSRDIVLFTTGVTGLLHEIFVHKGPERPSLLIVCAALVGLPIYLRQNGK